MTSGEELGKPSLLGTDNHFANVTIAFAHADPRAAVIVKSVLDSLGCRAILLARDGPELLARAAKEIIDICVIDSEVQPAGGVEAVSRLRQCDLPFVRGLPVILLGPGNNPEAVCAARDAGSNEYVRKPFTAKSLISSVHSVVNDPRPFVISKGFIGPDRRMRSSFTSMLPQKQERPCLRREVPVVLEADHHVYTGPEDSPKLILPDYRLKRRMGLDVPQRVAELAEPLDSVEKSLLATKEQFTRLVETQVREILTFNKLLVQKPDRVAITVAAIKQLGLSVQARTRELGFARTPDVARLLVDICDQFFVLGSDRSLILLEKHALTLMAMLQGGPEADAGPVGESLVKDLARQVAAFRGA